MKRYYLNVNGKKHGPFTPPELIKRGMTGKTLVMPEELFGWNRNDKWSRVSEDPYLFEYVLDPEGALKKDTPLVSRNNAGEIATNTVMSALGCCVYFFGIIGGIASLIIWSLI